MATKTALSVLLLMGLGFCAPVFADPLCQALPQSLSNKSLTLIELTDIALTCNPSTKLAWANTKISIANLGTAYSAFWPQLNGTMNLNYAGSTVGQSGISSSTSSSKKINVLSYAPGISVNYLLWDFGVRFHQVKAADFLVQAAQFSENTAYQQVILQVEQNYYQLIAQKASVKSNRDNVKENKANLEAALALHKQGMATILDVYQAHSALSQSQLSLEQSEGALKALEGQLAVSMGLPVTTSLKLLNLSDKVETNTVLESMNELLSIAKNNRPELLAADANVKASEAQFIAIKRKNWPSINLSSINQKIFSGNAPSVGRTNAVMLSLSIPIFSGFTDKYAIMQAEGQKEQAKATFENVALQVDLQVWQAYYALETAAKNIQTSREFLESSNQANKQAYGQYQAGVGNMLTVLSAQAALATARTQFVQARVNWYIALAEMAAALGKSNV